ncbi:MAG TPA: hypothetical protein DIV98_07855 [Oceanicaulis sp.]|nr:hypothetical protein [Oceanicaulis sp.]
MAAAALRDQRWDEARQRYQLLSVALDLPQAMSQRVMQAQSYLDQRAPAAEPVDMEAAPAEASEAVEPAPSEAAPQTAEQEEDGQ